MISWMYAFADRPAGRIEDSITFWTQVTGSEVSARRGDNQEFATLVPGDGDPFAKLQAVGDAGGVHLDLCTADTLGLVEKAVGLGASVVQHHGTWAVLRSPAGQLFCSVPWHGEQKRPEPVRGTRLGQVCVDVAAEDYEAEIAFWAGLTGWADRAARLPGFHVIGAPEGMPFRLLVQRLGEPRPAGAHLDLFCADVAATAAWHAELGAAVVEEHPFWTVMRDPAGGVYCLITGTP
ncbi:VOC family protein [Longispora albida]|uniref:VOC family protein n=1 Tax=Longispora albida TaxID=203523 RepID=UPI0003A6F450|nr:VOC family protein [Longispora albida]